MYKYPLRTLHYTILMQQVALSFQSFFFNSMSHLKWTLTWILLHCLVNNQNRTLLNIFFLMTGFDVISTRAHAKRKRLHDEKRCLACLFFIQWRCLRHLSNGPEFFFLCFACASFDVCSMERRKKHTITCFVCVSSLWCRRLKLLSADSSEIHRLTETICLCACLYERACCFPWMRFRNTSFSSFSISFFTFISEHSKLLASNNFLRLNECTTTPCADGEFAWIFVCSSQ